MTEETRVQVHIPYITLLESLEEVAADGINPEVFISGDVLEEAFTDDLSLISDTLGEGGLRITMHGPYMGLNPGSADEKKREHTVEVYGMALEAASFLGPVNMVLHAGYDERRFNGDVDLWLYQSLKTWPDVVSEAERLGITIVAENIFEKDPATLKLLVREIDSPNFRLCIDSGHLNLFSEVGPEVWFGEIGEFVAEVHLHDNGGKVDEHLPIGEGTIDFDDFFSNLKKYADNPVYTIEPHGEDGVRRGLEAIKRFL
jgi:sugar phosphate isomerase/epimerase